MKKLVPIFMVAVVALGFFKVFSKHQVLTPLKLEIDNKIEEVLKEGKDRRVSFINSDGDTFLVLSPPYQIISDKGQGIFLQATKAMQYEVDAKENGHLFLIRKGRVLAHAILSNHATPIYGFSNNSKINVLISRTETSGRPVRIELTK